MGWAGINIAAMDDLIAALEQDMEAAETAAGRIEGIYDRVGESCAVLPRIRADVAEMRAWVPDLRRRLSLAQQIAAGLYEDDFHGTVDVDEQMLAGLSVADARARGRRVAGRLTGGEYDAASLAEVQRLSVDPYFAAAFTAALGPESTLDVLSDPGLWTDDYQSVVDAIAGSLFTSSLGDRGVEMAERWARAVDDLGFPDVLRAGAARVVLGRLAAWGSPLPGRVEEALRRLRRLRGRVDGWARDADGDVQVNPSTGQPYPAGGDFAAVDQTWLSWAARQPVDVLRGFWDHTQWGMAAQLGPAFAEDPREFAADALAGMGQQFSTAEGWKQFGKDLIQYDAFTRGDVGYAHGALLPDAALAVATGGAATGLRAAAARSAAGLVAPAARGATVRQTIRRLRVSLKSATHGRGLGVILPDVHGISLAGSRSAGSPNPFDGLPPVVRAQLLTRLITDSKPSFPLSQANAEKVLRSGPERTTPKVAGVGVDGADVDFVDADGRVVARREVKSISGNANSFGREVRRAIEQVKYDGRAYIQVPEETDVDRWLRRWQGSRSDDDLNKYTKVDVVFSSPDGTEMGRYNAGTRIQRKNS